jgi:nitroreductase
MQTKEALLRRRSIRVFSTETLAPNVIEELVDSARFAPTARNVQPWEFIAITKKETLQKIAGLADNGRFIADCALCIAVFCQDTKYYLEDGCAATENILIRAADLGLAGCWVAGDKKPYCDKVRELLKVPGGFKLVSLIALGYSDAPISVPPKRALKEVLHWEEF